MGRGISGRLFPIGQNGQRPAVRDGPKYSSMPVGRNQHGHFHLASNLSAFLLIYLFIYLFIFSFVVYSTSRANK